MGFMTEMSILNDDWHRWEEMIRENPEGLIDELRELMNGRYLRGEQYRVLQSDTVKGVHLRVHRAHHADDPRVYLAYQNQFVALDPWLLENEWLANFDDPDHIQRRLAQIALAESQLKYTKKVLKEKLAEAKKS